MTTFDLQSSSLSKMPLDLFIALVSGCSMLL